MGLREVPLQLKCSQRLFQSCLAVAALLAPTSRGRMMTMPLQPHRAATPLTQRTWMMILTTDALMTSLCSDVILCVCDCALQVHVLQFTILY